jgi:hypothetical protein
MLPWVPIDPEGVDVAVMSLDCRILRRSLEFQ